MVLCGEICYVAKSFSPYFHLDVLHNVYISTDILISEVKKKHTKNTEYNDNNLEVFTTS